LNSTNRKDIGKRRPVLYAGVLHNSIYSLSKILAKEEGTKPLSVRERLYRAIKRLGAVDITKVDLFDHCGPGLISCLACGKEYRSISAAARETGISYRVLIRRHQNYPEGSDLGVKIEAPPREKNIFVDGVGYTSITAAAKALKIGFDTAKETIANARNGELIFTAADFKPKLIDRVKIDGQAYTSQSAAAKALGVSRQAVSARLKRAREKG
jgi:hypothetical protein